MKELLLLSASSYKDSGYLTHTKEWVGEFFAHANGGEILFIPYAGVTRTNDENENRLKEIFKELNIVSIHHYKDEKKAVEKASNFIVSGGNTFKLIYEIYARKIFEPLKERCQEGAFYFGWSAGANIAGQSIMTTNDMPIIYPPSFEGLNLLPFNINPHFISGKIPGHNGESKEQRLAEFMTLNPNSSVLALPEGSGLRVSGDKALVIGHSDILKMKFNTQTQSILVGETIGL